MSPDESPTRPRRAPGLVLGPTSVVLVHIERPEWRDAGPGQQQDREDGNRRNVRERIGRAGKATIRCARDVRKWA